MQLDETLRQSQSQPRALLEAAVGGIHLLELGEYALMVSRVDADAVVGYGQYQTLA
jgi:hypothetical protein